MNVQELDTRGTSLCYGELITLKNFVSSYIKLYNVFNDLHHHVGSLRDVLRKGECIALQ
jgi:hypothetical protein